MTVREAPWVRVRDAKREDLKRVGAWLGPDGDEFAGALHSYEAALEQKRLYVAVSAGVPVAAFYLEVDGTSVEPTIVVAPDARGRGIGGATLSAMRGLPQVASCERIVAAVRRDNVRAQRMLERLGYRKTIESDPEEPHSHAQYSLPL